MADNKLFYYFGDDEAYFKTLQGEFRTHTRLIIDFKRIYENDEMRIQSLFLKVFNDHPSVIFIDFSKKTQEYLHLARIIIRTTLEHSLVTVGLVDYLSPPEVMAESIATGVTLTHIKSAESYDVIFDVAKLIAPQEISAHGYATAKLNESIESGLTAKVGYIYGEGLHIETDHKANKGDRLKLNHFLTGNSIVPCREVFVKDVSTSNLFYHTKHSIDADFLFVDEFLPPEGMDEAAIIERKKEREESIRQHKKLLNKWIDDNLSRSEEKRFKLLVIDREFHFYQNQPRTDKYPYIIRCAPFLIDVSEELDKLQPKVIAFSMEKEDVQNAKNNNEAMVKLFEVIRVKFSALNPFVIIFNCPQDSRAIQEGVHYSNVMATGNELSVEVLLKMAELYEKKQSSTTINSKVLDKVFLQKTNAASICEIVVPITVTKLSETDLIFQTDFPLTIGTNLHLTTPVNMYINVQPMKAQGKVPEYHGLIHCLGEGQKKELRRYVNSIFFRDHDGKKQAEIEEFKRLNMTKLEERDKAQQQKEKQKQEDKERKDNAEKEKREQKEPSSEKVES